jgi:predicted anti-sigma-YlaC factor YlaD
MRKTQAAGSIVLLTTLLLTGCVKRYAINKLGDALAGGGTTYASDSDPELIGAALPFSLKLIESLLAESPNHRGLLTAAASGFTQYAFVYVQQDADQLEDHNLDKAKQMRLRARRLYLRARDYSLRGLDVSHPGFSTALRRDPRAAVLSATKKDVAFLYWAAASWGSAISVSKDVPELIADLGIVEALIDRALQVDESFDFGAIHSFLITYEMSRPGSAGDPAERSRRHFERTLVLTNRQSASPFVSFAEAVAVSAQNRAEFQKLLNEALSIDVDARPEWRLANLVIQRRARWLLLQSDQLFVE